MDPCERPATSHHLSWHTSGSGFQRGVTLSPLCYIVLFTHKNTVTKMLFIKGKKTRQNGTNSCSVSRLYINITLRMGLKMKVGKLQNDKFTRRGLFINLVELAKAIATRADNLGLVLPCCISSQGCS
jgi:hypothetical protein